MIIINQVVNRDGLHSVTGRCMLGLSWLVAMIKNLHLTSRRVQSMVHLGEEQWTKRNVERNHGSEVQRTRGGELRRFDQPAGCVFFEPGHQSSNGDVVLVIERERERESLNANDYSVQSAAARGCGGMVRPKP
jgi:hypothetical protein